MKRIVFDQDRVREVAERPPMRALDMCEGDTGYLPEPYVWRDIFGRFWMEGAFPLTDLRQRASDWYIECRRGTLVVSTTASWEPRRKRRFGPGGDDTLPVQVKSLTKGKTIYVHDNQN